jgi:hypothetical protein
MEFIGGVSEKFSTKKNSIPFLQRKSQEDEYMMSQKSSAEQLQVISMKIYSKF